ncbi:MAG: HAMP domain-containing histidine kinase [Chitinophagaceae bacterium]|nr:HAMP domain-containing histidine kinase [Chitinophagaceae bacterium]
MQKFRWLAILMGITILGITGFQLYWLNNNYSREKQSLELQTNALFRQTILKLQAAKMKLETVVLESGNGLPAPLSPSRVMIRQGKGKMDSLVDLKKARHKEPPVTIMNLLQEKMKEYSGDSATKNSLTISARIPSDSLMTGGARYFNSKISSITISTAHDSLIKIDPEMIREIAVKNMNKEGKPGEKVIAIGYSNNKNDSLAKDTVIIRKSAKTGDRKIPEILTEDIVHRDGQIHMQGKDAVFRFLYNVDSISVKDSVTIKEVTTAYAAKLKDDKMDLSFVVGRLDRDHTDSLAMNEVTIGFANPITYSLSLQNKMSYIVKKLTLPILFSFFLVGITIASFVLLYRSLLKQRKLAELKNQFISNITHELKTPIATVGVAIEALKNFNAIHDPQRTKEYLDISQNELQRLSLLVDKVLKLSMFEKKEIELKKEQFDCKHLVEEVMNSMKLQFDKYHAKVKLHTEGDNFIIDADKLHITSVIYNLLDNALKYSKGDPVIDVKLSSCPEYIEFSVSDNGIGIEPAYREKIFDKFFRVPAGDKHNTKGYGLGLSYVAEVIRRHHGQLRVESELGKGSTFIAKVPFSV